MNFLELIKQKHDVIIAMVMVSIIGIMFLPLPSYILDLLLTISISLSIIILITSVYIKKPLDFSVLPSMLLIGTLFRLSLNIASTRLILLKGHEGTAAAGQVINSFGTFVVGGDYAVGLIIFLILVTVNFVVITKGAGRIAEVAARFTLDAMPGKQMAIDADLNSGLIDDNEARERRSVISQESDFYGAMDGASKFVRGDAIAGLLITAINILGGLIIGVFQRGMPISEAAAAYTILTIGDGLVSQMPALIISTAAGLVVSRAGTDRDLGEDIGSQVLLNPKALYTVAGVLLVLGFVPGLPHMPFFLISAIAGGIAYIITNKPDEDEAPAHEEAAPQEPVIETLLEVDPLSLEIGYGLIPLVDEPTGELLGKIRAMRKQLATELGFIVPSIHIKDNLQLKPHEYSFLIRGNEIARGEVMMGNWLAVASEGAEKIEGIPTKDPTFGLPAYWIEEHEVERAQLSGYMAVNTATVIATHTTELLRKHGWEVLTRGEVQNLLDNISKAHPKIIEELIPGNLTLGAVQRVLQNLVKEKVSIKDLIIVLETLIEYSPNIKDPELLTELVRQALSRTITKPYMNADGRLPVFTLDPVFEGQLSQTGGDAVGPDIINRFIKSVEKVLGINKITDTHPIILCSANVRRTLRKIVERVAPSIVVLSTAEIVPSINLQVMNVVKYED